MKCILLLLVIYFVYYSTYIAYKSTILNCNNKLLYICTEKEQGMGESALAPNSNTNYDPLSYLVSIHINYLVDITNVFLSPFFNKPVFPVIFHTLFIFTLFWKWFFISVVVSVAFSLLPYCFHQVQWTKTADREKGGEWVKTKVKYMTNFKYMLNAIQISLSLSLANNGGNFEKIPSDCVWN